MKEWLETISDCELMQNLLGSARRHGLRTMSQAIGHSRMVPVPMNDVPRHFSSTLDTLKVPGNDAPFVARGVTRSAMCASALSNFPVQNALQLSRDLASHGACATLSVICFPKAACMYCRSIVLAGCAEGKSGNALRRISAGLWFYKT